METLKSDTKCIVEDEKNDLLIKRYMNQDVQGRIQTFLKSLHGWPVKKILGFRWSKKAEITLETISFWQNISISIFKFSKFTNALIRKEKKHSYSSQ